MPPSPPDSEKASWLTTDPKPSRHVTKVLDGILVRQNEYFIPGAGIDSQVLAEELPRYLGNGASQRPGTYEDRETGHVVQGYYIMAYRGLTTAMLVDIKADSVKREQARAQSRQVG
jgi:hypothetical protein